MSDYWPDENDVKRLKEVLEEAIAAKRQLERLQDIEIVEELWSLPTTEEKEH